MADRRDHKRKRVDEGVPRNSNNHNKKIRKTKRLSARSNFPPEFWDQLSQIPLTGRALRELDRRNDIQSPPPLLTSQEEAFSGSLAKFARRGGPNIVDLRGYPPPRSSTKFESSYTDSTEMTKKTSSSSRGPDFERHLADHSIYLHNRRSSALNIQDIRGKLSRSRSSLSLSRFSEEDFETFERTNDTIANEDDVMIDILPVIYEINKIFSKRNLLFTELKPITNESTTRPKPDVLDGARPGDIDKSIRDDEKVYPLIIPTRYLHVPVAPNFFMEVKSQSGDPAVLKRQACYDGAYGARAMHCLQNYGRDEPVYDGNAYTFSAIYHPGLSMLALYAHHVTAPTISGGKPEYHMTQIAGYYLVNNREGLIEALTAFRNLRDMAQEFRDGFIEAANAHAQNNVVDKPRSPKKRKTRALKPPAKKDKQALEPPQQKRRRATRRKPVEVSQKNQG
ncbi:hypothetical protein GGR55DRAFT_632303 [Xylaria sp. FL0064]|nr:hypothetical protein GGR55DRAFT_632303 [Xylaria sp. FL0064]